MTRRIITAEDVADLPADQPLVVDDQTTVTAPARELLRRRGIALVEGGGPAGPEQGSLETTLTTAPAVAAAPGEARRIIVTAVGVNRAGILAEVTTAVGQLGGDIQDVSQRITGGYFNAILVVDIARCGNCFTEYRDALTELASGSDYVVSAIDERVFSAMHRV